MYKYIKKSQNANFFNMSKCLVLSGAYVNSTAKESNPQPSKSVINTLPLKYRQVWSL